jgi:hypothetical protein
VRENSDHLEGIWNFWEVPDPHKRPNDAGPSPERRAAVEHDLTFDRPHGPAAWPTTQMAEAKILKSKRAPSISICRGQIGTYAVPLGKSRACRLFRGYGAADKAPHAVAAGTEKPKDTSPILIGLSATSYTKGLGSFLISVEYPISALSFDLKGAAGKAPHAINP